MKGTKLDLRKVQHRHYAQAIQSRRLGMPHFVTSAYKSDGGEDGDEKPEDKLLKTIQERIAEVTKDMPNKEAVQGLMTRALDGLDMEALKKYSEDKTKIETNVRSMAAELEKIKAAQQIANTRSSGGTPSLADNLINQFLKKNETQLRTIFESRQGVLDFNIRAAAVMTTANTVDSTIIPDDILESFMEAAYVKKRRPRQYVYDLADLTTVASIDKYITWLEEGDEEGAFALVSEGAVKPLVSYDLVRNLSSAKKVAGKYVVTEEFAKFYANAFRIIRELINDKAERDYAAILTTDLLADAASYVGTALDGQYTDPTDYHAIGAVAAQIQSLNFNPDVLILNPQDLWRISLQQNIQGSFYLPIPMYTPEGETMIMGFTIRTSNYVPVGTAILGESGLWKIRQEAWTMRMGYGVTVTGSNPVTNVVSDFDNNQFRVIVEKYFHNYIATAHAGSFVVFDFDTVKAALTAP